MTWRGTPILDSIGCSLQQLQWDIEPITNAPILPCCGRKSNYKMVLNAVYSTRCSEESENQSEERNFSRKDSQNKIYHEFGVGRIAHNIANDVCQNS